MKMNWYKYSKLKQNAKNHRKKKANAKKKDIIEKKSKRDMKSQKRNTTNEEYNPAIKRD